MTTAGEPQKRVNMNAAIGDRVHQAMWKKRLKQTEISTRMGIDQSTLSKKMRGVRPWLAEEVIDLADILDMEIDQLMPKRSKLTQEYVTHNRMTLGKGIATSRSRSGELLRQRAG